MYEQKAEALKLRSGPIRELIDALRNLTMRLSGQEEMFELHTIKKTTYPDTNVLHAHLLSE
jgi:hypothetical protein